MKVFTSNDFEGFYPVGTAAVVIAETEQEARELLKAAIFAQGIRPKDVDSFTVKEIDVTTAAAYILTDGNY